MAWIFDTYSMNVGHSVLGVVTASRCRSAARSPGRRDCARLALLHQNALQKQGGRLHDTRVAIQGFAMSARTWPGSWPTRACG